MAKKVTKFDLMVALVNLGWTEDRYGHAQRVTKQGTHLRVKFGATSVRIERQITIPASTYTPSKHEWVKVTGAYLKDVIINPDGTVVIGSKRIIKPETV